MILEILLQDTGSNFTDYQRWIETGFKKWTRQIVYNYLVPCREILSPDGA